MGILVKHCARFTVGYRTLPFAKSSRKDRYCGKVLVAMKVPEQPFQFKLYTNSCTSTSIAAKTSPQYLSLSENFANGSVPVSYHSLLIRTHPKPHGTEENHNSSYWLANETVLWPVLWPSCEALLT